MCKHCEGSWPVDYVQADVPAMDVQIVIEDVETRGGGVATHMVVFHQFNDDEARFKIKYCPMCGRRLTALREG